jgi:hypothetical protein
VGGGEFQRGGKRNSAQDQQLFKIAFLAPKSLQRMTTQGTAARLPPKHHQELILF